MRTKIVVAVLVLAALFKGGFCFVPVTEGTSCTTVDGRNGTCTALCPPNRIILDIDHICGFRKKTPITCCPNEESNKNLHAIEQACSDQDGFIIQDDIWRQSFLVFSPVLQSRVGEHSHMAVLGWRVEADTFEWDCGGSLIHPLYVLTAAHCLSNKGKLPDVVRFGSIDLESHDNNKSVQTFEIHKSFQHPDYKEDENYNDIALLQIDGRDDEKGTPRVACLWTERENPHKNLLAMGYGASEFGKASNLKLYQGNLSVIETDNCQQYYTDIDGLPRGLIDSQICAVDPENVLDTCQGDSGGPLLFDDWRFKQTSNKYEKKAYLIGVTSFGSLCRTGVPGVYTRIYPYLSWIEGIISRAVVDTGKGYTISIR